jgi:hypothetical protein
MAVPAGAVFCFFGQERVAVPHGSRPNPTCRLPSLIKGMKGLALGTLWSKQQTVTSHNKVFNLCPERNDRIMTRSKMNRWKLGLALSLMFALPLPVWSSGTDESIQTFYHSPKSGKLIDFVGDSTTEAAQGLYDRLTEIYAAPGGVLEGARFRNRGSSGNTLHHFVNQVAAHGNTLDNVIQDQADLRDQRYPGKQPCAD